MAANTHSKYKEHNDNKKPISASDQLVSGIQTGAGDGVIPLTPPSVDMVQEKDVRPGDISDNAGMPGQGPNPLVVYDDIMIATPAPVTVDMSHGEGTSDESSPESEMGLDTGSHIVTLDRITGLENADSNIETVEGISTCNVCGYTS